LINREQEYLVVLQLSSWIVGPHCAPTNFFQRASSPTSQFLVHLVGKIEAASADRRASPPAEHQRGIGA
jgi:hypothetical protein